MYKSIVDYAYLLKLTLSMFFMPLRPWTVCYWSVIETAFFVVLIFFFKHSLFNFTSKFKYDTFMKVIKYGCNHGNMTNLNEMLNTRSYKTNAFEI